MPAKKSVRRVVIGFAIVAALVTVRVVLQPHGRPPREIRLTGQERLHVRASLAASALDRRDLVASLAARRVLLVGESHFVEEPQAWLCELLRDLHAADGRKAVLLLELPPRSATGISAYIADGDEAALATAFGSEALPYQHIVRWARAHPEAVAGIVPTDENTWHVGAMRLFLTDTRNETMTRAVTAAVEAHPAERIVAYGGRLHMGRAGRYMYDSPSRRPIGARLPEHGVAREAISSIWLFVGEPPADGAWDVPMAVSLAGEAGKLPLAAFEEEAIFGAERFGEIADYAVYLGPATRIGDR